MLQLSVCIHNRNRGLPFQKLEDTESHAGEWVRCTLVETRDILRATVFPDSSSVALNTMLCSSERWDKREI